MAKNEVDRSGAAVRFPPPVAGILTIVAGYVMGRWIPLLTDYDLATPDRYWIGGGIALAALLVLGLWPIRLFRDTEQNVTPWSDTPEIIIEGPYKFTRNPMYLMMLLVNFGFAVIFSEPWILIFLPGLALALYHIAIKHEEIYLEQKFGESYLTYKRSVRRWI
ncbi:MAG: isoprenylcysteine carboxylmethyltransferase family protein [Proteobacteria bacterium]|nr:isoprenylcysteine carboxylmethyltransferase family protein [Pseudomonadota bacterium]MDA0994654.1 isoprenylcysteine carboxylmethyltransferase family protein [Pseudomonadota bacterium]